MIGRIAALAAIAVLMGSSVVAAGAKDGHSDEATLAQDRMVIEDTLRRYVRALDDSDLDAYLATLADDAKFVSAEGSYAGKEAIRKYVEPVMHSRKQRRESLRLRWSLARALSPVLQPPWQRVRYLGHRAESPCRLSASACMNSR